MLLASDETDKLEDSNEPKELKETYDKHVEEVFEKVTELHLPDNPDVTLRITKQHPSIVNLYIPLMKDPEKTLLSAEVWELIQNRPEYAESLFPVFKNYPELIKPYAEKALVSDDSLDTTTFLSDSVSRISDSKNPEKVVGYIQRNQKLFDNLTKYFKDDEDWVTAEKLDDIAEVNLQYINRGVSNLEAVRVAVRLSSEDLGFLNWDVFVSKRGFVFTQDRPFKDFGYLKRERGGVNEATLLELLERKVLGDETVPHLFSRKGEGGVGIYEYIEKEI